MFTVLVGGQDGLKETTGADNFAQNVKKIEDATGLKVSGTIDETTPTGAGLTLQIGDTADDFNQMKVVVGDIHTKAMGIADIDIGNQAGAAAAIQTVRAAINYVSGMCGDLGAVQNRLEHTGNNLSVMAENIQDAESTIRDTDRCSKRNNGLRKEQHTCTIGSSHACTGESGAAGRVAITGIIERFIHIYQAKKGRAAARPPPVS